MRINLYFLEILSKKSIKNENINDLRAKLIQYMPSKDKRKGDTLWSFEIRIEIIGLVRLGKVRLG